MREVNQRMFDRVVQAFGQGHETAISDLFGAAFRFIDMGLPLYARSLLGHSLEIHSEADLFIDGVVSESDVYLEVFRRAFYDEETAARYGTQDVALDQRAVASITSILLSEALGMLPGEQAAEDLEGYDLSNVAVLPAAKGVH